MRKLTILLLLITGCSSRIDPKDFKSDEYSINFSESNWTTMPEKDADKAYTNKNTGSIILINSLCKKYTSSDLENVSSNLLGGITHLEILEKKSVSYREREAIDTKASGKIDGVKVFLNTRTFKRNHCTYDFALIMPNQILKDDENSFFNLLENKVSFK